MALVVERNCIFINFSCHVDITVFKWFSHVHFVASGQDSAGGSRHRIGPIAQSVVLGTLNVGDPGEAVVPDLNRVCLC